MYIYTKHKKNTSNKNKTKNLLLFYINSFKLSLFLLFL